MEKEKLAQQLRQPKNSKSLIQTFLVDSINQLSDEKILTLANTCDCCGELLVAEEQLDEVIANSKDVTDFFKKQRAWVKQAQRN